MSSEVEVASVVMIESSLLWAGCQSRASVLRGCKHFALTAVAASDFDVMDAAALTDVPSLISVAGPRAVASHEDVTGYAVEFDSELALIIGRLHSHVLFPVSWTYNV